MFFAAARYRFFTALLVVAAFSLDCSETSFKVEEKIEPPPPEPENHIVAINGITDLEDAGERIVNVIDTVDFTFTAMASKIVETETETLHPVDLYFVIDSSGSMENEIALVKQALIKIADQLKEKKVDLWAGFIGFIDDEASIQNNRYHELTGDLESLKTFISEVQTKGNLDNPEGSLMASKYALDRFIAGDGRDNATKTVLLITDVVGHNGGKEALPKDIVRDCDITSLGEKIQTLGAKLGDQGRVKFFYAVPDAANLASGDAGDVTMANHKCLVGNKDEPKQEMVIKDQMNFLIDNILPAVRKESRGGPLLDENGKMNWPIAENNLVGSLVPLLESTKPEKQTLQCAATKVTAFEGEKQFFEWNAKSIESILKSPKNSILLDDVIAESIERVPGEHIVRFEINRCCIDTSEESENKCIKEYTQKAIFRVIDEND